MNKPFKYIGLSLIIGISSLSLTSCDETTKEILNEVVSGNEDEENGNGLKEALRVGVDTAVSRLNVTDGYFRDAAIKLLLPQAINDKVTTLRSKQVNILGNISLSGEDLYNGVTIKDPLFGTTLLQVNGLKSKEDDLILGLNRAAEDAAGKAKPIFVSAITGMTLTDVSNILFGGSDTAATSFLKTNTYSNLETEFQPKIDSSLQAVKVGGKSVAQLYEDYATEYNNIVTKSIPGVTGNVGSLLGISSVQEPNLASYSTKKGLDGLFLKVSDEEKNIRQNPLARVTDLLSKVFGQLDNK